MTFPMTFTGSAATGLFPLEIGVRPQKTQQAGSRGQYATSPISNSVLASLLSEVPNPPSTPRSRLQKASLIALVP